MKKEKLTGTKSEKRHIRPALSDEARENQLISLATDLAEQQLRDGTASSQIITELLKRGSEKQKLELERLQEENKLLRAKTEAIESAARVEELYKNALDAMKLYSGNGGSRDEDIY